LIRSVQQDLRCGNERTVSLGSSKGGSAAAYFALKHGFAHGLAMVPQFRIGTFISHSAGRRETLEDMVGQNVTAQAVERLDSLFVNALEGNDHTKLHILTSENDEQYSQQILPLLDSLKTSGHEVVLENRIMAHDQAAGYNVEFVHNKLRECVFGAFLQQQNGTLRARLENSHRPQNLSVEYIWENPRGKTQKLVLTESEQAIPLDDILWGELRVRNAEEELYRRYYCPWITDSLSAVCSQTKTAWEVEFKAAQSNKPQFLHAFYIFDSKNCKAYVQNYTTETKFLVPRDGAVGKKVQLFWKYKDWSFSRTRAMDEELVDISELSYELEVENGILQFRICDDVDCGSAQFGYYVKRNGETVFKQHYSDSKCLQYRVTEAGSYSVSYFLKQGEHKEYRESRAVEYSSEA